MPATVGDDGAFVPPAPICARATVANISHASENVGMKTVVRLGERGRLVLPREVRRRLALHTGDELLAIVDDDTSVRLVPRRTAAYDLLGAAGTPDTSLSAVDELLLERRREAQRDEGPAPAPHR